MQVGVKPLNSKVFLKKLRKPLDAGVNRPVDGSQDAFIFAVRFMVLHDQHQNVVNEMAIEEVILACEIKEMSPDLDKEYAKHWPEKAKLSYIPHIEFDEEIKKVKAVIRTGGYWLHAPNVILQAGCTYDE